MADPRSPGGGGLSATGELYLIKKIRPICFLKGLIVNRHDGLYWLQQLIALFSAMPYMVTSLNDLEMAPVLIRSAL